MTKDGGSTDVFAVLVVQLGGQMFKIIFVVYTLETFRRNLNVVCDEIIYRGCSLSPFYIYSSPSATLIIPPAHVG